MFFCRGRHNSPPVLVDMEILFFGWYSPVCHIGVLMWRLRCDTQARCPSTILQYELQKIFCSQRSQCQFHCTRILLNWSLETRAWTLGESKFWHLQTCYILSPLHWRTLSEHCQRGNNSLCVKFPVLGVPALCGHSSNSDTNTWVVNGMAWSWEHAWISKKDINFDEIGLGMCSKYRHQSRFNNSNNWEGKCD